ncbi:hypothetical protein EJ05DRAFT_244208 [Pseudovirgaria hyperparasitica]|uniref:MICOS complex subunit n=1 Tax=Pseudovirgaria hyperparasitica TaxID=470096 RepID=A0A6A6WFR5_9PEZI|nr:uncharacterized protein EJ05DRAFT_244208 [Pseudovirgaria hyperparasitica]KAF2760860.1 hypothetical protein EJ05DRAFT_244208 [Pseudovirgaria hyperparasitica]
MTTWAMPSRELYAEEHPSSESSDISRKPIYDDLPLSIPSPAAVAAAPAVNTPDTPKTAPTARTAPTPTDRLASQIRRARLAAHASAQRTEDALDDALSSAMNTERSVAGTIASLAPPKGSGERLLPGSIYVLVAAMAGSIVSRNRNILLRFSVPAAVGLGAAYTILPLTMRNVGDLVWSWEEKYPELARRHVQVKERVERVWETGKAHSQMTVGMVEEKVGEARGAVEGWVKKGR